MHSTQPRGPADEGRGRLAFRSRPLLAPSAPDRIPIGEVRGAEALDLLKAWGTGHPGGIGTIHAGSALGLCAGWSSSSRRRWSPCRALSSPRPSISSPSPLRARGQPPPRRTRPRGRAGTGTAITASPRRAADRDGHQHRRPFMTRPLHRLRAQAAHAVTYATVTLMLAGPARAAGSSMPGRRRCNRSSSRSRAGRQDHRRDHHHRHWPDAALGTPPGVSVA